MVVRMTTGAVMNKYAYNLQRSSYSKYCAQNTVLTGRNFNSFSEDSTSAARAFQLRCSLSTAESQYTVGDSVAKKYDVAWNALQSVISDVTGMEGNSALAAIVKGATDTSGSGRVALGIQLEQLAESIVQTMNTKYGYNFVFAGADGLNAPLSLDEDGTLYYRGIDVNTTVPEVMMSNGTPTPGTDTNGDACYTLADGSGKTITVDKYNQLQSDYNTLKYLSNDDGKGETKYVDMGLGLSVTNGEISSTTAVDVSLSAIYYLGYGTDEDGDPNNIVNIIGRMGALLKGCDGDGNWSDDEEAEFTRLFEKFTAASDELSDRYIEMDVRASYIKSNLEILDEKIYNLGLQISDVEDVDEAEAITAYSWAQYCYNAALKVGNSILSESLMDYLR